MWELRGVSCLEINEVEEAKQSITTSRSFGRPVLTQEELTEAICSFGARGGEKLRAEQRLASWLQVFIVTREEEYGRYHYAHIALAQPSDFTPHLLNCATQGLKAIFRPGLTYRKAGILLGGLVPKTNYQQDLFVTQDLIDEEKKRAAMTLLDKANGKFGYQVLQFASEGIHRPWQRKCAMRSPCFTTKWSDLLTINI